jgi:hypothetical protein
MKSPVALLADDRRLLAVLLDLGLPSTPLSLVVVAELPPLDQRRREVVVRPLLALSRDSVRNRLIAPRVRSSSAEKLNPCDDTGGQGEDDRRRKGAKSFLGLIFFHVVEEEGEPGVEEDEEEPMALAGE